MRRCVNVQPVKDAYGEIRGVVVHKLGMDGVQTVTVVIGGTYVVKPDNPKKMKHRDRIVVVREFLEDHKGIRALVRFKDDNRFGRIDVEDLENIEEPSRLGRLLG